MPATIFSRFGATRLAALAWSVLLAGALWLPAQTRPWQAVDNKAFDMFTSLVAPHHSALPVVILAIDEPSFSQLQQHWPFPRRLHAQVLERLRTKGTVDRKAAAGRSYEYFASLSRLDQANESIQAALDNAGDRAAALMLLAGSLTANDRNFLAGALAAQAKKRKKSTQ